MYHKTRLTYDISVMTSFGIPMWISTLSSACTATWDCALHAWCGQSVLWIKIQLTKSFQLDGAKRNKSCMHVLTSATTYKKAHRVCCRPDQHSFSGRRLKFISLANLFCLHSSMRLRSCFLLAKMLSIEFIQAHIQNSSDHHENFDEKRRNRFACITKHAWHMTYLWWQCFGIPTWISTLSSACTATWDCALHAWCEHFGHIFSEKTNTDACIL